MKNLYTHETLRPIISDVIYKLNQLIQPLSIEEYDFVYLYDNFEQGINCYIVIDITKDYFDAFEDRTWSFKNVWIDHLKIHNHIKNELLDFYIYVVDDSLEFAKEMLENDDAYDADQLDLARKQMTIYKEIFINLYELKEKNWDEIK